MFEEEDVFFQTRLSAGNNLYIVCISSTETLSRELAFKIKVANLYKTILVIVGHSYKGKCMLLKLSCVVCNVGFLEVPLGYQVIRDRNSSVSSLVRHITYNNKKIKTKKGIKSK